MYLLLQQRSFNLAQSLLKQSYLWGFPLHLKGLYKAHHLQGPGTKQYRHLWTSPNRDVKAHRSVPQGQLGTPPAYLDGLLFHNQSNQWKHMTQEFTWSTCTPLRLLEGIFHYWDSKTMLQIYTLLSVITINTITYQEKHQIRYIQAKA